MAQNEKLITLFQSHQKESDNMLGMRVVYYRPDPPSNSNSDHADKHNTHWNKALGDDCLVLEAGTTSDDCLEAGTITKVSIENTPVTVVVCWDCGECQTYSPDLWQYLRVYSLGPTGYLGQMVFCDKCLEPSRGLAFRLAKKNQSIGDLYDLCHTCYDQCDDEHVNSRFHCNMPSGNIDLHVKESEKVLLSPRQGLKKHKVAGIFKGATVEINGTPTQGQILNIVHEEGAYDLRKAKHYDSCAEVKLKTQGSEKASLVYKEAGSGGKVELKAIEPGIAPSPIPVEHYPPLGINIIEQMLTYKEKLMKINEGRNDCFMRHKDGGCYSLTISGTTLSQINDREIWKCCKELRIVILMRNELNELPPELRSFSNTIELVCIQHNRFTEVPSILFHLEHIKHLNLHGNQISEFPEEMKMLTRLERLKFGENKLYTLPDIFGCFEHLIEITFNNNYLTRLPPSFQELKQLESVDLRDNSFTCIPAPLLNLRKLKVLYLDWNRIQRLAPLEDCKGKGTHELLGRLVSLKLRGNPVYEQLKTRYSLADDTNLLELVRTKFSELHKIPLSRALRVLVLGSCGAGKTSIVEALCFDKYVTPTTEAHHDHTVGINRFSIPVRMKSSSGEEIVTELRLWDFAGERSYIMMNSLFLTEGTLILLAVNFETYECTDSSFHENVAIWLQQVVTKSVRPVVWIIGTHADKCTDSVNKIHHIETGVSKVCKVFKKEIEKELTRLKSIQKDQRYTDRSPACVRKSIEDLEKLNASNVPCLVAKNLKVFCLTNTHTFSGFKEFRDQLEHFHEDSPFDHLTTELTESEHRATDKLRKKTEELLATRNVPPVLDQEDVLHILQDELGHNSTKEDAKWLLQYLHQAGHLLACKPHPDIILDVDWLIDLLKQVFHHNFEAMIEEKKNTFAFNNLSKQYIDHAVKEQERSGIISKQLLEALWPLDEAIFQYLIKLLQTYGLAYETIDLSHSPGYLFPWLVTEESSHLVPSSDQLTQISVFYDFFPCLPSCFLQHLAVRCKRHFSIPAVFKDLFSVKLPLKQNEVTAYVRISHEENKLCGKVDIQVCTQTQTCITVSINEIWDIAMTIIKEMELLLCRWAFYGNLQRKVYCPKCTKHFWELHIYQTNVPDNPFFCQVCWKHIDKDLVAPQKSSLLSDFVDEYSEFSLAQQLQSWSILGDQAHSVLPANVQPDEPQAPSGPIHSNDNQSIRPFNTIFPESISSSNSQDSYSPGHFQVPVPEVGGRTSPIHDDSAEL